MKIMLDAADEVTSIVSGKLALRYAGQEINAMKSIAKAAANRYACLFSVFRKLLLQLNLVSCPVLHQLKW